MAVLRWLERRAPRLVGAWSIGFAMWPLGACVEGATDGSPGEDPSGNAAGSGGGVASSGAGGVAGKAPDSRAGNGGTTTSVGSGGGGSSSSSGAAGNAQAGGSTSSDGDTPPTRPLNVTATKALHSHAFLPKEADPS